MQSNRPRNTELEVAFRAALHRAGLRFFKHRRPLPGLRCEPDLIFPRLKIAVFVDGCYWHGCPEHTSWPKTNEVWWRNKIEQNRSRDDRNHRALGEAGWTVVRVWEHEPIEEAVGRVMGIVSERRTGPPPTADATR
jgi:DNA mismatch endonuclease (patch repair protein)